MVGPARFERATLCLEGRCSIQLSYGPVHLFYQRREKSRCKLCSSAAGEAEGYIYQDGFVGAVWLSQQSPCSSLRCFEVQTPLPTYTFPCANARQSKSFYDIVLSIDAYRLTQLLTPEMCCRHAGWLSSRERHISETCISR